VRAADRRDAGRRTGRSRLTLALLVLPVVILSTREALRAVPKSLREGSYALGATKWQTIRHQVLPAGFGNILTGVILAMSRAIGAYDGNRDVIDIVAVFAEEKIFPDFSGTRPAEERATSALRGFQGIVRVNHLAGQKNIGDHAVQFLGAHVLSHQSDKEMGLRADMIDELGLVILRDEVQHAPEQRHAQQQPKHKHAKNQARRQTVEKSRHYFPSTQSSATTRIPCVAAAVSAHR